VPDDRPLAVLIDERMRAAGITDDDPGLVALREWNRAVTAGAADQAAPEPLLQPPSADREGREAMSRTTCGREGCGADIEWAVPDDPAKDSKMPVDYWSAKDPQGTLAIHRDQGDGQLRYRMLTKAKPDLRRGEVRGVAHWVTCRNPPPKRGKDRETCPQCPHPPHTEACARLGKVECRPVGAALVRGQFPCACTHGVAS